MMDNGCIDVLFWASNFLHYPLNYPFKAPKLKMSINNEFKCVFWTSNYNITVFCSQLCTVTVQLDSAPFIALLITVNIRYNEWIKGIGKHCVESQSQTVRKRMIEQETERKRDCFNPLNLSLSSALTLHHPLTDPLCLPVCSLLAGSAGFSWGQ